MTKIFFLGLAKSETELYIDEKHRHNIPTPTSRVKQVVYSCVPPVAGDLLYIYNAAVDKDQNVIIHAFTRIPYVHYVTEEEAKTMAAPFPPERGYVDDEPVVQNDLRLDKRDVLQGLEDPQVPPSAIL